MLGFLHVASSQNSDDWMRRSTLILSPAAAPSVESDFSDLQSRKVKRELQSQMNKATNYLSISPFRASAIIGVFLTTFLLATMINIRPLMANQTLLSSFSLFNQHQFGEAEKSFRKALELAKGTIGTTEIREHLTFNVYNLFSSPGLLQKPEAEALYYLAVEEMEKQVAENSAKNLDIKHNILLAQLYHQRALLARDPEAFKQALNQYEKAIQFAPNYIGTYPIVSNLLAQVGNINGALNYIKKVEELLVGIGRYDERIFYSKPLFYVALKRYDEAYEALKEISVKYSGTEHRLNAAMMENIVEATRAQGQDAIPFLEKIHQLDGNFTSAPLMLAQINAALGKADRARFYALEALKQDPSSKDKVDEFFKELNKANFKR